MPLIRSALFWLGLAAVACCGMTAVKADLPFTTSYARQCTPLNVTWTPTADSYPYSVYILGVGTSVQSYRINSDYQPNAQQITFQYSVPLPSPTFQSFIVAVADNKGNGNSSSVLIIDTNGPDNCAVYAQTSAFIYASDSTTGQPSDRPQCGSLRYYPVNPPFRGTSPFSFTYVPLGNKPITVNIPARATTNTSYFVYEGVLPLQAGTQFYQFMSDATGGGSGGGSPIYTIGASSNSSCLASTYSLANEDTNNVLPVGSQTASFENLSGAIEASTPSSSGGTNHGGLIGGIIGAVIGVGGILVIIGAYLIYRKRQKRKRELERKEQPQFVDLDEDDVAEANANRRRNQGGGVRQSYSVSPFTYDPATNATQSPDNGSSEMMLLRNGHDVGGGGANGAAYIPGHNVLRSMSTTTSEFNASTRQSHQAGHPDAASLYNEYDRMMTGTIGSQSGTGSWQQHPSTRQTQRTTSEEYNSVYSASSPTNHPLPTGSLSPARVNSFATAAAGTAETFGIRPGRSTGGGQQQGEGTLSSLGGTVDSSLPYEVMMGRPPAVPAPATGTHDSSRSTYLQHRDAGPVRPEQFLEEMPPSYGQWIVPPTASSVNKNGQQPDNKREGGGTL